MTNRNLTLNLPLDLIRKTKAQAAERGKTINAFVREVLEETVMQREKTRRALEHFLELAEKGPRSNVDPGTIKREEIYDRW